MTANSGYISSKEFGEDPKSQETFMIVDMQEYYLDCSDWPYIHDEFGLLKQNVIDNIRNRIEYTLDMWWKIILVEYAWHGKTIPEITSKISGQPIVLKKTTDWLLDIKNEYRRMALQELEKFRDSSIGIWWVSISACVVGSLVTLILDWFNANVLLDCSMNIDAYWLKWTYFYEENTLGTIIKAFSEKDPYLRNIISQSMDWMLYSWEKSYIDRLIHPVIDLNKLTPADHGKHLWEVGLSQ